MNGTDAEAAFLIESHSIVIFRVDTQDQLTAAEGLRQCPDFLHHGFADTMTADGLLHHNTIHPEKLPFHGSRTALMLNRQYNISRHDSVDLCHIYHTVSDIFQKPIPGIGLLMVEVNIRPPGGMKIMDLHGKSLDILPIGGSCQL